MTPPSNRDKARLAVDRLEQEIAARDAAGETLPLNGGALHLGLICQIVGVGRAAVQQNPRFHRILRAYADRTGVSFSRQSKSDKPISALVEASVGIDSDLVAASRLRDAERRADAAERRVAELLARNAELLAEIRCVRASEDLVVSGRRFVLPITSGPACLEAGDRKD